MLDALVFIPIWFVDDLLINPVRPSSIVIAWSVFSAFVCCAYNVVFHATRGQTLGKMALRVKVLDVDEGRIPTLKQALIRESVAIAFSALYTGRLIYVVLADQFTSRFQFADGEWLLVGYAGLGWSLLEVLTMLTNKRRRAVHDLMAGTVVVRTA